MSRKNNVLPPTQRQTENGLLTQNKKRKKRRNRSKKAVQVSMSPTNRQLASASRRVEEFRLSPCSQSYLKALVNPFDLAGGVACIPDLLDLPSFKFLSVTRGTLVIGTASVGWITVRGNPTNDQTSILVTDAAFTLNSIQVTPTVGVSGQGQTQNPFTASQFSDAGFLWRLVGMGLRARYLGTELNRSGRVIPVRTSSLGSNLVNMVAASCLSRPEIPSVAVTRNWTTVTYLPVTNGIDRDGYNYENAAFSIVPNPGVNAGDIGLFVDGCVPGSSFEWELYAHYEVASARGSVSPPGVTASHSDMPGLSAIRDVLEGNLPAGESPGVDYNYYMKLIRMYAPEDMSSIVSGLVKTGKALGPYLLTQ